MICKPFFSPQNAILAIAGDDDTVRLHDVRKKKMVCEFKAHETRQVCFRCHKPPVKLV